MSDDYTTGTYARMVMRDGAKRVTRYVRIITESATGPNVGQRVTRDGDTWEKESADTVAREVVVWMPGDVIRRTDMRMSMTYGTLVEAVRRD
jgi:hypothetical protein